MIEQALPAFLLGLLGAGHCVGMCGGIAAALGLNSPGRIVYSLLYQLGRMSSYVLIGLLFGFFSSLIPTSFILYLRLAAAFLLLAMAIYLAGIWNALSGIEKAGKLVWMLVQPIAVKIKRPDTKLLAFIAGMAWGWLPCGMVYSALGLASLSANPVNSGLIMMAFGLGTFPAMAGLTIFSQSFVKLIAHRYTRMLSAFIVLLMGLWTAYSALGALH